jgi:hypothetical protein
MEYIVIAQLSQICQEFNITDFLKTIAPILGGAIGAIMGAFSAQFLVYRRERIRERADRVKKMELAYSKLLALKTSLVVTHKAYLASIGKIIVNRYIQKSRKEDGRINSSLRLEAIIDYSNARSDYFKVLDSLLETTGLIKTYATYLDDKRSLELQDMVDKIDKIIFVGNEKILILPEDNLSEEEFRNWLQEKDIEAGTFRDKELGPVYVGLVNKLTDEMMNDRKTIEIMERDFWKFW